MSLTDKILYALPFVIFAYFMWRYSKMKKVNLDIPLLVKEGAVIVDVRSPSEFAAASKPGTVNIPLDQLPKRVNELPQKKPIILVCASGGRSRMGVGILKKHGFEKTFNAGSWMNL